MPIILVSRFSEVHEEPRCISRRLQGSIMSILALFLIAGCLRSETTAPQGPDQDVNRVLVLINENSPNSMTVGGYYVSKRQIPKSNVLFLKLPVGQSFPQSEFETKIANPIRQKIRSLKSQIDFIVTTKEFPLLFDSGPRYSVDAFIMAMDRKVEPMPQKFSRADIERCINPYFSRAEAFSSKQHGIYLVTRIDGYTVDDCKRLIDNSLAAKPQKGLFLFDDDPTKPNETYSRLPDGMRKASEILREKGFEAIYDRTTQYLGSTVPVMGYVDWGSNDSNFVGPRQRAIRWHPGAIAETFVSTSARSFQRETTGQSMIADLIVTGVTGIKGYVSEPYTIALARPDILFDRYTSGFNLAESFYMASPLIKWKDVVIGDPLCAPFRKR